MNVTGCLAAAAVSIGLSGLTVSADVAEPPIPGHPQAITSTPPTGIGWSWEWDDDDDDWEQTATWECPAGCSITFEDNY